MMVFPFRFAEKLFPPFVEIEQARLKARENFDVATEFIVEIKAGKGVFDEHGVFQTIWGELGFATFASAEKKLVDVATGDGEREKPDRREDGIATADAVGNGESFVTFPVRFRAESARFGVGCREDAFFRFRLTVFFN